MRLSENIQINNKGLATSAKMDEVPRVESPAPLMSVRKAIASVVYSSHLDESVDEMSIDNSKIFHTKVRKVQKAIFTVLRNFEVIEKIS